MRRLSISLAAAIVLTHGATLQGAQAQSVMLPANADMRAMQAPADWEGSRSQRTQDNDPDSVKWSATAAVPKAEPQVIAAPPSVAVPGAPDFRVDVWDSENRVVETMAHCSTLSIGKAAFKEAAKERPGKRVTLRRDTLVVAAREATLK